ncbi:MAG: SDR family NAD(P)-dependent oxidoreductase, partial [Beijerinckiaceae bacterium]|nr:SDR family NAD(P)-dependent oxidoreductase [Beijerinckiaceae bacterium]
MEDLKDKIVLITGGSTGIGAATAEAFAANGAKVIIHYNASVDEAKALVARIQAKGGEAALVHGDVMDRSQSKQIVAKALALYGRID